MDWRREKAEGEDTIGADVGAFGDLGKDQEPIASIGALDGPETSVFIACGERMLSVLECLDLLLLCVII